MSESDSSVREKVVALAKALMEVHMQIGRMGRFSRSFHKWFGAKGSDAIPRVRNPRDGSKEVLEAAAEFWETVATADRMLSALPVEALELLSELVGGAHWDMRTRRTLRAIQRETCFMKRHYRDPEGLLSQLRSLGKDGFMQMQSKLVEIRLELNERLLDLDSLPEKFLKLDRIAALPAIPKTKEPYKWKDQLAEDHWIYENIHANSFNDLMVKHNEHCQSKKNFKKVLTRRAYWARSDRYADYHLLPKRRFKGACECPDCQTVTDTPLTTD
jgi:hypothetical protein